MRVKRKYPQLLEAIQVVDDHKCITIGDETIFCERGDWVVKNEKGTLEAYSNEWFTSQFIEVTS